MKREDFNNLLHEITNELESLLMGDLSYEESMEQISYNLEKEGYEENFINEMKKLLEASKETILHSKNRQINEGTKVVSTASASKTRRKAISVNTHNENEESLADVATNLADDFDFDIDDL